MKLKRRTKLASIRTTVVMALLLLFWPSLGSGQVYFPLLKEKQREEIEKKLIRQEKVTPEELELYIEDQRERQAEAEYIERNKPKEGFLKTVYRMLTETPDGGIQTADVVLGVKDTRDPDAPGGHVIGRTYSPPEPPQKSALDVFVEKMRAEEDEASKPTPGEIIRAKIAARRAKNALEAAKKLAQAEKITTEAQAASAIEAQQSTGCFPCDIRVVMADGTVKPIAEVKAGDLVMTYDIGYERTTGKAVLRAYSVKSNHLYTVNGDFKTTGGERLLTPSGWKPLDSLGRQDFVHVNGRMTGVETIDYQRMELTTYNLEVDDTHNFHVQTQSGNSYLVHNCGGGGK